ncbi:MAG: bile acid:sodium symporter family protein [Gammaproteobacteria bacterium]
MWTTTLFPVSAIAVAILSFLQPHILSPYGSAIIPLLGVVMLGMGMTLRPENFLQICARPKLIALGVSLQFLVMPLIAYVVGIVLGLQEALLVGLVLVGSCPGGTASNVICYLARGDVALSITLTTTSTILAVLFTPLLTWFYIGERVPVPVLEMMLNIFLIILLPVTTGVLVNHYLGRHLGIVKRIFPTISVFAIILIIGIIVALNKAQILMVAWPVLAAVFWHNILGLACGYLLARLFRLDGKICRTLAIEVGMQNSGLGVALAHGYFAAMTMATLPGAIFSIWHNISGSLLAGYWSRKPANGPAA